ncbi:MAG: apolipoprotein N-acyltransferase [Desulfosalsimonas sp.]|uniref:apolipoprotein N-acyltransferase n=1 Tax=Desulfosalsimonas sp. TaxID=3073848 RepID=UPI00397102D6
MKLSPEKSLSLFFCIAAGVVLACAFDKIGAGFAAWFAPGLLLAGICRVRRRAAFLLGVLAGFVHYLLLLYWLVTTMHRYGPMPVWLSFFALLLLAFYLALYTGVFAWAVTLVPVRPVFLVVWVPVCWVALEYAKTFLFTGFPWGLAGYSQYRYPVLIQSADLFGVYGVSFFVCAVSAGLFLFFMHLFHGRWQNRLVGRGAAIAGLLVAAGLFAANGGYGIFRLAEQDAADRPAGQLRVSVIQANIEQSLKWDDAYVEATLDKYIRLSVSAAEKQPDLVVWPETAVPFYFFHDSQRTRRVLDTAERMQTRLLAGAPAYERQEESSGLDLFNSAYLIDVQGRVAGRYDKVHLVPFGEYVPLKKWLPFVGKIVPETGDFSPGRPGRLLSAGNRDMGADMGVQICYEIIFPHLSAAMVRAGADILVNITNDAWFGDTSAPFQHFSMAVFRAVENRRPVVRAANTGISGFIDSAGRIRASSGVFQTTSLTRDVALAGGEVAFYTRCSHLLPGLCAAAALVFVLAGLRKGLRSRRAS